jgi:GT2 family glycosyltransferase
VPVQAFAYSYNNLIFECGPEFRHPVFVMIDHCHKQSVTGARFSLLIPTWNNLKYLQLCVRSITLNSTFVHQIIIHVNEGTDGTLAWVKEMGFSYTFSRNNIGICWAMNAMRRLIDTEYIVFLNDDMYVCPGWDAALDEEIRSLPDNRFYLSSTIIQPRKFWCKSIIAPFSFGEDTESFREDDLLKHYMDIPHGDWSGSTWPPVIVHRDLWDLVGGYSIEFSPGLYSDNDFSAKLFLAGVRYFKGINKSRVYHFEARSTGRVKRNRGNRQFLFKWGIVSSAFMRHILRRGNPFIVMNKKRKSIKPVLWRSRLKLIGYSFSGTGCREKLWGE